MDETPNGCGQQQCTETEHFYLDFILKQLEDIVSDDDDDTSSETRRITLREPDGELLQIEIPKSVWVLKETDISQFSDKILQYLDIAKAKKQTFLHLDPRNIYQQERETLLEILRYWMFPNLHALMEVKDHCEWVGVLCGNVQFQSHANAPVTVVVKLDFSNHGLKGRIPSTLANLEFLSVIQLSGNDLTGGIPPELSNLYFLRALDVSKNLLTGTVPILSELFELYLSDNLLTGDVIIPSKSLNTLDVSYNALTGNIRVSKSLEYLDASHNRLLTSSLTDALNLPQLTTLDLSSNGLKMEIPRHYPPNLALLNLADNYFTGSIDTVMSQSCLRALLLSYNDITGAIPSSRSEETEIISNNNEVEINSEIPGYGVSDLFALMVDHNHMEGTVPAEWFVAQRQSLR
jgi:hypothetical protein